MFRRKAVGCQRIQNTGIDLRWTGFGRQCFRKTIDVRVYDLLKEKDRMKLLDRTLSIIYHIIFFFERIFRYCSKMRFRNPDISRMASLKGFRKEY